MPQSSAVDWEDLRYFLAVARSGSLTDAARELCVSYSTVSRRLATLEEGLGTRLFDRLASGYQLTGAGAEMLESARRMEAEFAALSRRVQGRDARLAGRLRVATTDALASTFMPELAAFTRRYPEIELDLVTTPAPAELALREVEVALLVTAALVGLTAASRRSPRALVAGLGVSLLLVAAYAREPATLAIVSMWATGFTLSLPPVLYLAGFGAMTFAAVSWAERPDTRHLAAGLALLLVAGLQPQALHHGITAILGQMLLATPTSGSTSGPQIEEVSNAA